MERKEFCEMIRVAVEEAGVLPMDLVDNKIAAHYYGDIKGERNSKLSVFIDVLNYIDRVLIVSFNNQRSITITDEEVLQNELEETVERIGNQSEVARMMQCSISNVASLRQKHTRVTLDMFISFCEAFGGKVEIKISKTPNEERKKFCELVKEEVEKSETSPAELIENNVLPNYYEIIDGKRDFKLEAFINLLGYIGKSIIIKNSSKFIFLSDIDVFHTEFCDKAEEVGGLREAARRVGYSVKYFSNLKQKKVPFMFDFFLSYCKALGYDVSIRGKKANDVNRREIGKLMEKAVEESNVSPTIIIKDKIAPNYRADVSGNRNFKMETPIRLFSYLGKTIVLSSNEHDRVEITADDDICDLMGEKIKEYGGQSEVARMLDCPRSTITRVRQKSIRITIDLFSSFCNTFGYKVAIEQKPPRS